ncbi:MAG TPA: amidohydrolase family protein [Actinocatenispora sp.]
MLRLTGTDPISGRTLRVIVESGRIAAIEPAPGDTTAVLSAGLVDLQVNGYGGFDVNAATVDEATVAGLARALWARGVTTFCPTVITASPASILAALRAVRAARDADPLVAHAIPVVHVEGPHLSAADGARGAHDPAWIRPADTAEFDAWQAASGGLVGIVTVAPEAPGAVPYLRHVAEAGVLPAIGHSAADPAQVRAAVDAGARMSTHLGNGVPQRLPRHPNLLWEQLADDRLTAGLIADGHHLPAATLRAMARAKGPDRTVLVSDAVALAGAEPGDYRTPVGGAVTLHPDGRLTLAGSDLLAGAARGLPDCVAYAAGRGGLGLAEALRSATVRPAALLGRPDRGVLRVGAVADLTVFTDATLGTAAATVVGGELVYTNGSLPVDDTGAR